jgi:hypothetical protein
MYSLLAGWLVVFKAQAPSKNFFSLIVNKLGVVFRVWIINPAFAVHNADAHKSMTESVATLHDFLLGDVQEDIRRVNAALLPRALEVFLFFLF